jgi:hypothetical protein
VHSPDVLSHIVGNFLRLLESCTRSKRHIKEAAFESTVERHDPAPSFVAYKRRLRGSG